MTATTPKPIHRVRDVDPQARTGNCVICGPDAEVRLQKKDRYPYWICLTVLRRRSPEAQARQRERRANTRTVRGLRGGVPTSEYQALLEHQGGVCAICGGLNVTGRSLDVDHCHATQQIRALLCNACNTSIGLMKEDPERLRNAARYIESHLPLADTG